MATPLFASGPAAPRTPPASRRSSGARILQWIRNLHLYLGLFITPALLFFALTGALQTLSLHEAAGESYRPPAWIAHLAQIHKNQTSQLRPRRPVSPSGPPAALSAKAPATPFVGDTAAHVGVPPVTAAPAPPRSLAGKMRLHLPLKIFFLLVSLGLFSSSLTGICMAYRFERNKVLVTAILLAGLVVPLILLRF